MSLACPDRIPASAAWAFTADATLIVALALCVAVAAALAAKRVRFLPLVTAYIVAGIVIGPHALALVSAEQVAELTPLRDIALAVVLFTIGTRFELDVFRRLRRRVVRWGLFDAACVAPLVFAGVFALARDFEVAALMALIALEIAPAATFLVLRETASSGPMTRLILNAVVVNNVAVIALFSLVYPVAQLLAHGGGGWGLLIGPASIAGSIALGTALGLAVSVAEQKYESDAERLLLLLGGILLSLGLSRLLGFEPFLICPLVAGVVLGNSSAKTEHVRRLIERIDAPFYVIFFVLAGASLHLGYLFSPQAGLIASAYIALRAAGRLAGGALGGRGLPLEPRVLRWFPASVLSHSAIAIALVTILTRDHPAGAAGHEKFQTLSAAVLAAVAVYELAAPVLLKLALTVSGEVSVARTLMRGHGVATVGAFKQVTHRLSQALGVVAPSVPADLGKAHLEQIIIRDVQALHVDHDFRKVLAFVSHSEFDCFPVVDAEGYYVGYINYFHIENLAYDPAIGDLVIAGDIMVRGSELRLDSDSPSRMAERFSGSNTTHLPVVQPAEGDPSRLALVGLMRQRTLMRFILARSAAEQARKAEESPPPPDEQGEK